MMCDGHTKLKLFGADHLKVHFQIPIKGCTNLLEPHVTYQELIEIKWNKEYSMTKYVDQSRIQINGNDLKNDKLFSKFLHAYMIYL